MNTRLLALALIAGFAAPAFAQEAPAAAPAPAADKPPLQVFQALPAGSTPFESLVQRGADGKILPIAGVLDAHAIMRNPLIDEATRAKAAPVIEDWAADVNQLAIDYLDFLEQIDEEGLIDKLDFNNTDQVRHMSQVMVPFMSAGPLAARLQSKGALTADQAQVSQNISNDYLQASFNEIMAGGIPDPIRNEADAMAQQDKIENVNKLTQFLYYTSCRDARESYHRIMIDSAAMVDGVVGGMGLSSEDLSRVQPAVVAVKSARTDAEKKERVRALLKNFSFDQRRDYLQQAVESGAAKNPLNAIPAS